MLILDSDHLRVLQYTNSASARLTDRLLTANQPVATTIISVEESIRGWMVQIGRAKAGRPQVLYYTQLAALFAFFGTWVILPFAESAAAEFERLQALHLRSIGTQDLKIAAIAATYPHAMLLSANARHFNLVPGLVVEDWIHSPGTPN
ncbi:MAG TPA: type II toxin-antitoxin system VapC family toxin [Chloroflexia bacterium]|nr:type II toxin-antitoxin system VapC family toxin [Chloroflexia bacterium]